MKVLKFGGTSVGSVESIRQVVEIINQTPGKKIVVLSAFSGITNLLVELSTLLKNQQKPYDKIQQLEKRCLQIINYLFETNNSKKAASNFLELRINEIEAFFSSSFSSDVERIILAQGEIISTHIIQFYLQEKEVDSVLISALDFMRIDENGEPNSNQIKNLLNPILQEKTSTTYLTQGFICKDQLGNISNLNRGGSDYSASLIGAALEVYEIQIWTDIDGMHNNDPRFVENTFSINKISFDEAAELAYFGAKILHPQSLFPAKEKGIPVLVKNTFQPEQKGTLISNNSSGKSVTSIAAKDGIIAIKIKSYRMLMAYGFLKKVFEVFETYKTPIDMITTSEVAISLTIDNYTHLNKILEELQPFGSIEIDTDLSIVCVVGDFSQDKEGISTNIFKALKNIPIRMISYGGSNYNISLLVKTTDKPEALNVLNRALFNVSKLVLV